MIGIFMSISIIFVLISLSLGLEKAIEEEFQKLGSDKFFVMPRGQLAGPGSGGAVKLTENDVEVIERVSGVRETSYFVTTSAKVQFREDIRFVTVVGIKPDKASVLIDAGYMEPQTGKILERGDRGKALTGSQYSDKLFSRPVEVGDKLTINDVHEVKVKGIWSR
jgi:ABC-type lipoprotein release transport system permease subunit